VRVIQIRMGPNAPFNVGNEAKQLTIVKSLAKTLLLLQANRGIKREPVMLEPQSLEP
jgi:hypothetical protein